MTYDIFQVLKNRIKSSVTVTGKGREVCTYNVYCTVCTVLAVRIILYLLYIQQGHWVNLCFGRIFHLFLETVVSSGVSQAHLRDVTHGWAGGSRTWKKCRKNISYSGICP